MFTSNSKIRMWLAALALSGLIILAVDRAYQMTGGARNIAPGWTETEFNWRFSRPSPSKKIYIVGASHVNWGVAETVIKDMLQSECNFSIDVANVGLSGHNALSILEQMADAKLDPGVIVFSYDPISSAVFTRSAPKVRRDVLRQAMQDANISVKISSLLPTFSQTPDDLIAHFSNRSTPVKNGQLYWRTRTVYREGMVAGERAIYGSNENVSFERLQQDQISRMETRLIDLSSDNAKVEASSTRFANIFSVLKDQGHKTYLTRLPASESFSNSMTAHTPQTIQLDIMAETNGLPLIMLEPINQTYDGSHLSYEGALLASQTLAKELLNQNICQQLSHLAD